MNKYLKSVLFNVEGHKMKLYLNIEVEKLKNGDFKIYSPTMDFKLEDDSYTEDLAIMEFLECIKPIIEFHDTLKKVLQLFINIYKIEERKPWEINKEGFEYV